MKAFGFAEGSFIIVRFEASAGCHAHSGNLIADQRKNALKTLPVSADSIYTLLTSVSPRSGSVP